VLQSGAASFSSPAVHKRAEPPHFVERGRASEAGCRQLDAGQGGVALAAGEAPSLSISPGPRRDHFAPDEPESPHTVELPAALQAARTIAATLSVVSPLTKGAPGRPGAVRPPVKAPKARTTVQSLDGRARGHDP
jgi:hypothetical protein